MQPEGKIVPTKALCYARREEMFALMMRYYENVRPGEFAADLAEKDWVITLTDTRTGRLCGFSTQMLFPVEIGGQSITALFSGDTIVEERFRSRNPLAGLWGRLASRLIERFPAGALSWFLISKGYKTYRFLPVFFRDFYPRHDLPTPRSLQELIDAFAAGKFFGGYDRETGIVRANANGCRLRPGAADVTSRRLRDPHVRFFCERNPQHTDGDELCCVAPLRRDNFTPAARKVIKSVPELPPQILADIDNRCEKLLSGIAGTVTVS